MKKEEIEFCKFWEEVVLPNRNNVQQGWLEHSQNLLGKIYLFGNCSTCLHNAAIDLKNLYYRLLPYYEQYKEEQKKPIEIEKPVEIKNEVIEEELFAAPTPKKKSTRK